MGECGSRRKRSLLDTVRHACSPYARLPGATKQLALGSGDVALHAAAVHSVVAVPQDPQTRSGCKAQAREGPHPGETQRRCQAHPRPCLQGGGQGKGEDCLFMQVRLASRQHAQALCAFCCIKAVCAPHLTEGVLTEQLCGARLSSAEGCLEFAVINLQLCLELH